MKVIHSLKDPIKMPPEKICHNCGVSSPGENCQVCGWSFSNHLFTSDNEMLCKNSFAEVLKGKFRFLKHFDYAVECESGGCCREVFQLPVNHLVKIFKNSMIDPNDVFVLALEHRLNQQRSIGELIEIVNFIRQHASGNKFIEHCYAVCALGTQYKSPELLREVLPVLSGTKYHLYSVLVKLEFFPQEVDDRNKAINEALQSERSESVDRIAAQLVRLGHHNEAIALAGKVSEMPKKDQVWSSISIELARSGFFNQTQQCVPQIQDVKIKVKALIEILPLYGFHNFNEFKNLNIDLTLYHQFMKDIEHPEKAGYYVS